MQSRIPSHEVGLVPKSSTRTRLKLLRVLFPILLLATFLHSETEEGAGTVSFTIEDQSTGKPTAVRARLINSDGKPVSPPENALSVPGTVVGIPQQALAVMWGRNDVAEGFARLPDGSFYVDGGFQADLPPGEYTLEISKGYEYRKTTQTFKIESGRNLDRNVELKRWIDMPERGWYSADDHIHLRRSPRENPLILRWIAAEDIHVGNILQMGDFWGTVYSQYGWGEAGRYQEGDYILSSGQEDPRTPEIGHTISLGASDFVRHRDDYYLYNLVFDEVHELGGISGYAHQGMSFNGYRGMTLDVHQKKLDFLELLQFCVNEGPLHLKHYYHFLDLGFRLTATAGSDFPWCGRGPDFGLEEGCSQIGDARFYTHLEEPLTFDSWLKNVKKGRTFVSSGPMLEFTVNEALPGDTLDVVPGTVLKVQAKAYGEKDQIPLQELEIVAHGEVLQSITSGSDRDQEHLILEKELEVERGLWIAARCRAGTAQVAHTTPVYVTVNGKGFHNPATVPRYLQQSLAYLQEIEDSIDAADMGSLDRQIWRHGEELRRRVNEVRASLEDLRNELSTE